MVGKSLNVFIKRVFVEKHISDIMYENPGGTASGATAPLLSCANVHNAKYRVCDFMLLFSSQITLSVDSWRVKAWFWHEQLLSLRREKASLTNFVHNCVQQNSKNYCYFIKKNSINNQF